VLRITVRENLEWHLNTDYPYIRTDNDLNSRVDPYPCYPHDQYLVREEANYAFEKCPIPEEFRPTFDLLKFDTLERVNAWTRRKFEWRYNGPKHLNPWKSGIVLLGKRIPIHPAMTRYLVAHEYGHVVDYYLQRFYEDKDPTQDDNILDEEYREIRKLPYSDDYYGGPTWDREVGEVIANDFRILVLEKEVEFWPHPISRPENVPAVIAWWDQKMGLIRDAASSPQLVETEAATVAGV
jgi:hypothetical protein